jgi:hypothetical protein
MKYVIIIIILEKQGYILAIFEQCGRIKLIILKYHIL